MSSWPVCALVVVWSALLSLLGGGSTVTGGPLLRTFLAALAGAAACGFVLLVSWLVLRRLDGVSRIVLALVSVVVAGLVRGAALQTGLVEFGLAESGTSGLALRMATSVVTIPAAFLVGASAVGAVMSYRESAARLLAEQQRLVALIDVSAIGIEERQAEAIDRVQERLDEELRVIAEEGDASAVSALETLAGDVVRPLSHSLARDLPRWDEQVPQQVPRVRWIDVWRDPEPRVAIQPVLLPVFMLVIAIPSALLIYEPRYGITALVVGISVLAGILALGRGWLRRQPPRSPLVSWLSIIGVLLLGAVVGATFTDLADGSGSSSGVFPALALFAVPVFGLLIATAAMMGARMREITEQLESVTRQLQWSLARVHTQQWEQSGRLSRALHGPVQSMLHARLLRLRRQVESGDVDQLDVENLRADLQAALVSALAPLDTPRPVTEVLAEVAETWDGVARVTWEVSPEAAAALGGDHLCTQAITDLATEAVSNAVRHGSASAVEVRIVQESAGDVALIVLRVIDDGAVAEEGMPGLGTALLTRCTYDWSLSRATPTTLTARLPVVASALLATA